LHQQFHRQRLRLAHRQRHGTADVGELLDDFQHAGERGLIDAGREQAVDHAVEAVERLRQQRGGLGAARAREQTHDVDARLDFAQDAEEFGGIGGTDAALDEEALGRLRERGFQDAGDVLPAARTRADEVIVVELGLGVVEFVRTHAEVRHDLRRKAHGHRMRKKRVDDRLDVEMKHAVRQRRAHVV